ncbi:MAG: hypothetical protein HYZ34_04245 [Ignavibacteriae bacterium]|nr:hypothetical protein [Ignavibacteriota bacterium]
MKTLTEFTIGDGSWKCGDKDAEAENQEGIVQTTSSGVHREKYMLHTHGKVRNEGKITKRRFQTIILEKRESLSVR